MSDNECKLATPFKSQNDASGRRDALVGGSALR